MLELIKFEYQNARNKHAPMHSGHEGYAVIKEELDELWELVKADNATGLEAMHEAMQIGAMALAYMVEITE